MFRDDDDRPAHGPGSFVHLDVRSSYSRLTSPERRRGAPAGRMPWTVFTVIHRRVHPARRRQSLGCLNFDTDQVLSIPLDWSIRTTVGTFTTTDRSTWHSTDGAWTAELRRSRNRRHIYLALFHEQRYLGRYDAAGWRPAMDRSRICHLRSSQLPLGLVA